MQTQLASRLNFVQDFVNTFPREYRLSGLVITG